MNPQQAWQSVLSQLQGQLSEAEFNTWVQDARVIAANGETISIGVQNAYARDWLEDRLADQTDRLLSEILEQPVSARFVVASKDGVIHEEKEEHDALDQSDEVDQAISIRIDSDSLRDIFIQKTKIVAIPGYFRRWIPYLGPTKAWVVVGLLQVAYLATQKPAQPGVEFKTTMEQIGAWVGLSKSSVYRSLQSHLIRWFIEPKGQGEYKINATIPLTPGDEEHIRQWIMSSQGDGGPVIMLKKALKAPRNTLLPKYPPLPEDRFLNLEPRPRTLMDLINSLYWITVDDYPQIEELVSKLEAKLFPQNDLIVIPHYFLKHNKPLLGNGPAWLVTLLRDELFPQDEDGHDGVWASDQEIARMLGLRSTRSIRNWIRPPEDTRAAKISQTLTGPNNDQRDQKRTHVSRFIQRTKHKGERWMHSVTLHEPLTPEHQRLFHMAWGLIQAFQRKNALDALIYLLKNDLDESTYEDEMPMNLRLKLSRISLPADFPSGKFGTASGKNGTGSGKFGTPSGKSGTGSGKNGTASGKFETPIRKIWNALISLKPFKESFLNYLLNTFQPPGQRRPASGEAAAQDGWWDLGFLIQRSELLPKSKQALMKRQNELSAWIFVSHTLQAYHNPKIENPPAVLAANLKSNGTQSYGGVYDDLALLPAGRLASLIERTVQSFADESVVSWESENPRWNQYIQKMSLPRLQKLQNCLVPKTN